MPSDSEAGQCPPEPTPVGSVFHLVVPGDWPPTGLYQPPSLASEGFVHLSFADQVAGSANRHYAGAPELLVVELDAALIGVPLRVEDSYGTGTAFPHAYGPLPVGAAVDVRPLARGADGRWQFTPDDASGRASPGR